MSHKPELSITNYVMAMYYDFFSSKMSINEPKMFIIFFGGVRYAMGKMSINNPFRGWASA